MQIFEVMKGKRKQKKKKHFAERKQFSDPQEMRDSPWKIHLEKLVGADFERLYIMSY